MVLVQVKRTERLVSRHVTIDMLDPCRRISLDVVGTLFLGQSFEALDAEQLHECFEWMDNSPLDLGVKFAIPWADKVLGLS